jgi:hypothetical protein
MAAIKVSDNGFCNWQFQFHPYLLFCKPVGDYHLFFSTKNRIADA